MDDKTIEKLLKESNKTFLNKDIDKLILKFDDKFNKDIILLISLFVNHKIDINNYINTLLFTLSNESLINNKQFPKYFPIFYYNKGDDKDKPYKILNYIINILNEFIIKCDELKDIVENIEFYIKDNLIFRDIYNEFVSLKNKIHNVFKFKLNIMILHMIDIEKIKFYKKILDKELIIDKLDDVLQIDVTYKADKKHIINFIETNYIYSIESLQILIVQQLNVDISILERKQQIKCIRIYKNLLRDILKRFDGYDYINEIIDIYFKIYDKILIIKSLQREFGNTIHSFSNIHTEENINKIKSSIQIFTGLAILSNEILSIYNDNNYINFDKDFKKIDDMKNISERFYSYSKIIFKNINNCIKEEERDILYYYLKNPQKTNKTNNINPTYGIKIDFIKPIITQLDDILPKSSLKISSESSSKSNEDYYTISDKFRKLVKKTINKKDNRNIIKLLRESLQDFFLLKKNESVLNNNNKIILRQVFPLSYDSDVVYQYSTYIKSNKKPPKFLSYYFPDLYSMILNDNKQEIYFNNMKYEFLNVQKKLIEDLDSFGKTIISSWTYQGDSAINGILTLLYQLNCTNLFDNINTIEEYNKKLDDAIIYLYNVELFQDLFYKFLKETYRPNINPLEYFKDNSFYNLKKFLIDYIESLYNISEYLKYETNNILGEDFIDNANIYLFRGQNDLSYKNCKEADIECIRSTSVNFLAALNFTKNIKTNTHNYDYLSKKFVDGNLYIYRLKSTMSYIYMEPISEFPEELEMLLLPTDKIAFLSMLNYTKPYLYRNIASRDEPDISSDSLSSSNKDPIDVITRMMNKLSIESKRIIKSREIPKIKISHNNNDYINLSFDPLNRIRNKRIKVCLVEDI